MYLVMRLFLYGSALKGCAALRCVCCTSVVSHAHLSVSALAQWTLRIVAMVLLMTVKIVIACLTLIG